MLLYHLEHGFERRTTTFHNNILMGAPQTRVKLEATSRRRGSVEVSRHIVSIRVEWFSGHIWDVLDVFWRILEGFWRCLEGF